MSRRFLRGRDSERKNSRTEVRVSAEEYNSLLGLVTSVENVLECDCIGSPFVMEKLFKSYRRYQDAAFKQVSKWEIPKTRKTERKKKDACGQ